MTLPPNVLVILARLAEEEGIARSHVVEDLLLREAALRGWDVLPPENGTRTDFVGPETESGSSSNCPGVSGDGR